MRTRTQFQTELETLHGDRKVFFQPPPSMQVGNKCIIYKLSDVDTKHADNGLYLAYRKYEVILVDPDPDTPYFNALLEFEHSSFNRHYTANNLHHYVFTIFY